MADTEDRAGREDRAGKIEKTGKFEKIEKMHMGRLIQVLSHQMKRRNVLSDMAAENGLTVMQLHVLKFILLESMKRDVYQKDVEEEFQIRKSTATGILKLMEGNGFIVRECARQDARLKKLIPTKKAEALRPGILAHIEKTEEFLTRDIPPEDVLTCKRVMCRMFYKLAGNNLDNEKYEQQQEVSRKDE